MSILRDKAMIALNELSVACREAANRYAAAAEAAEDAELAARLDELAGSRTAKADELAQIIVEHDDIPDVPNSERELLHNVATKLSAVLSADERQALLRACESADAAVVEAAEQVLALSVDAPAEALARGLREDAASQLRPLLDRYAKD